MSTIREVREYWQRHPLLSHELPDHGSPAFFERFDRIKREDAERYSADYWRFAAYPGRRVLDVGCGPGWVAVSYARGGARVHAIDLTQAATRLTTDHLAYRGLSAHVAQASAEQLPFAEGSFDLVVSSGVLHHTPDTQRAFRECFRVLRSGGEARITLYHLGVLHHPALFPFLRLGLRVLRVRHPGATLADAEDPAELVRRYDGAGNPVGIAKTTAAWAADLEAVGFQVVSAVLHYFPRRFLPFARMVPSRAHRLLDRRLGTMVYFDLRRP